MVHLLLEIRFDAFKGCIDFERGKKMGCAICTAHFLEND